jgi:probable rRNA maturation factor
MVENLQDRIDVNEDIIRTAVELVMKEEKIDGEINVVFADDNYVKKLNKKYSGKDRPTDVLAFPMDSDGIIGDVLVSADRAREQADEYGHPAETELILLAVHGALHLCGYRDKNPDERRIMQKRQDEIVRKVRQR